MFGTGNGLQFFQNGRFITYPEELNEDSINAILKITREASGLEHTAPDETPQGR